MTRRIFVAQFETPQSSPPTAPPSKRSVLILAASLSDASDTAESLREPHEKLTITEAHEPVFEAFPGNTSACLYEGIAKPQPAIA